MNMLEIKDIFSVLNDYDIFLFDLWGVIVEGSELYPGVVEEINKISEIKKVYFVSNAPRPTFFSLQKLRSWGLNVTAEKIFTSGEIARQIIISAYSNLKDKPFNIYHLGSDRNDDILAGLDIKLTTDINLANILLLTIFRDEGENLEEFDELLKKALEVGTMNICANPDIIIPNLGKNRYCAGYFAQKIEQFGGKVIYTGKPYEEIFNKVLSTIKEVSKERILMIGDTFETDIIGAQRVGIHSALVMTGNAQKFHSEYNLQEEKLSSLTKAATIAGAMPNFIIKIGS